MLLSSSENAFNKRGILCSETGLPLHLGVKSTLLPRQLGLLRWHRLGGLGTQLSISQSGGWKPETKVRADSVSVRPFRFLDGCS